MSKQKKGKKKKVNNNRNKKIEKTSLDTNYKSSIIVIVVILAVLALFYLLTIVILNKKEFIVNNNASIQYSKILAGESFSQEDRDYLVFYFDMSKNPEYADLVSKYREKEKKLPIYTVNLAEGLNKSFVSDSDNILVTKPENLRIKDSLIIRFKDNEVSDYTTSSFEEFLNNNVE